jgi:hypothetical protein
MFNTLKYARMLEEVGFSRDQAETSIRILVETMEDKLASKQDLKDLDVSLKQDLKDLDVSLKQDMKVLEISLKQDMKELETSLKQDMKELDFKIQQTESKLTIRMGTMLAASIAIITALQVYVFKLLAIHS